MAIISLEDVVGIFEDRRLLCTNCANKSTPQKSDDYLLESQKEDDKIYFCDECDIEL